MPGKRERRPGEIVFIAILLAFSLVALQQAFGISGLSNISGAGVFPMLAAGTMILSALAILRDTLANSVMNEPGSIARRFVEEVTPLRLVVVIVLIFAYVAAMPLVGFIYSSAGFLFLMLAYLWRKGILVSLALSGFSLALIYVVFRLLFQVVLPQGTLWQ